MSDGVACPEPARRDGGRRRAERPRRRRRRRTAAGTRLRLAAMMTITTTNAAIRRLVLVRNHEAAIGTPYLNRPSITYAADGAGGTTNLIFDAKRGRWVKAWSTLAGTIRNCAGGVTPWGTWITVRGNRRRRPRLELRGRRRDAATRRRSSTWAASRTKR